MECYRLIGLFLMTYAVVATSENEMDKKYQSGPKTESVKLENANVKNEETELLKLMENSVNDDVGKAVPVQIPQKVISGVIPQPAPPGKNWGRKMNEEQWRQNQARLKPKGLESNKKVMHNRNTINDNRHDKKGMKIPRHAP